MPCSERDMIVRTAVVTTRNSRLNVIQVASAPRQNSRPRKAIGCSTVRGDGREVIDPG